MRSSRFSRSLLAALVVAALFVPVAQSGAAPVRAMRPAVGSPLTAMVRTLGLTESLPGAPIPVSPVAGTLSDDDPIDVYSVDLKAGQTLAVDLNGPTGTYFGAVVFYNDPAHPQTLDTAEPVYASLGDGPDGEGYPQEMDFVAGTTGTYSIGIVAVDGVGAYTMTWSRIEPPIDMGRLAGPNRYETALAVSKEAYAAGEATHVVLATGAKFADALAASALAGAYDCPILLTPSTKLADGVATEIDRLRGSAGCTVMIVGSGSAVSDEIAAYLDARPGVAVKRFAGPDRYGTAMAIAKEVKRHETADLGHTWKSAAFFTRGDNYADALSCAPIAFRNKIPVVLVRPTSVPASVTAVTSDLSLKYAWVLGDGKSVSDAVVTALGVPSAWRIAGADRIQTSVELAGKALANGWASNSSLAVGLTTSRNFPDGLGGGVLIGRMNGVLLLTDPGYEWISDDAYGFVYDNQTKISAMRAFGNNASVSDLVFPDFLDAMQP